MIWRRNHNNDYHVELEADDLRINSVRGLIVRCPVTHRYKNRWWRTQCRWMLLINNKFDGWYETMRGAKKKFEDEHVKKET